jgi:carboxylate-amine ligase
MDDTVLIAALARALVGAAAADWRDGRPPPQVRSELIRLASWRASRYGLRGELLDPDSWQPRPAWQVVDRLLAYVGDALARTGDAVLVGRQLEIIRARGTGSVVQRRVAETKNDLAEVVRAVVELSQES